MPKMRQNLRLEEVSLVDNPANKGARVALFKRNGAHKAQDFTPIPPSDAQDERRLNNPSASEQREWGDTANAALSVFLDNNMGEQRARRIAKAVATRRMAGKSGRSNDRDVQPIPPDDAQDEPQLNEPDAAAQREWGDTANAALDVLADEGFGEDSARQLAKAIATKRLIENSDVEKREFSQERRRELAEQGKALPDGSFPIVNKTDLQNAIQAFGRSNNKAQVAKHIAKRARALGATDMLPDEGELANLIDKREAVAKADRAGLVEVCRKMMDGTQTTDFRTALASEMDEQRIREVHDTMFPLIDALRESLMTTAAQMSGEQRDQKIRENVEAFLSAVQEKLDGASDDHAQKVFKARRPDTAGSPGTHHTSGGGKMTQEEMEKRLGDLESQVSQLTKQAEEHGLTVNKADDGTLTLQKKADDEAITDPDGNTIRKSDVGPAAFQAVKVQNERIAKLEAEREAEALRKRANNELPNLAGTPDQKAALIKAVDSIQDGDTRKAVQDSLKAADASVSRLFSEIGKTATDDHAAKNFKNRVDEVQKRDNIKRSEAFEKAAKEFPDEAEEYRRAQ